MLALKTRLPLKALWLLTFLSFSILLSIQPSERGAIILHLLRTTRNANLGAQELGRNHMPSQTKESGLRDAVLTSPMELGQAAECALLGCRAQVQS